jgi:predicted ATPase/class 3 adenylate cyclase/Tfp pilus assembly protein PilF
MQDRTFLFTDIEGSTTLWERFPEPMRNALARHDLILRNVIERHNGNVFKTVGDSFCAVFPSVYDALTASAAAQHCLDQETWESMSEPIRVRMAIHLGPAEARDGDFFGQSLNRVARMLSAAHGGQIVLSRAARDSVGTHLPEQGSLTDLGEHRLRDLVRPEQIFQYNEPGLRQDFPLLRSLSVFAHNLPEPLTSFIGREMELAEIKHLLSRTRLLTLSGSGGSGKSRLALQAAADVVDRFPNGVWFVDMATVTDPQLIATTVATTLRLHEAMGHTMLETLIAFLHEKRFLLILDNCEQVVSACADFADKLLKACPDLYILATSREGLGIAGETTLCIPSLPTPSNQDLQSFERIAENPSVRLFVDRAASTAPGFRLTSKNAPAIVKVCQRLDGIPLAIELAAARVKTISPEEIVLRLNDRFRLLTGGSRTALPRHQTLRAAIEWSYHLLGGLEGVLFRRLSLFCGSFSLEAAESVCQDDALQSIDILDCICRLVDKSLLILEQSEGSARYRMLETIREYAFERLRESGEVLPMQVRFMSFFVNFTQIAERELSRPAQVEWLEKLEIEIENLRAALGWAVQDDEIVKKQLYMAIALSRFWLVRGYWEEGLAYLCRVAASPAANALASERSRALNSCGSLACQLGRYPEALQHYEQSLAIRRNLKDERGAAATLNNMGMVHRHQGELETARPLFDEALKLFRNLGHDAAVASCLTNLAALELATGQQDAAHRSAEEALELFTKIGDQLGVSASLTELGRVALAQGQWDAAQSYFEDSLARSRNVGEKIGVVECLQSLGELMILRKNFDAARSFFEESLDIARGLASARHMTTATDAIERLNQGTTRPFRVEAVPAGR